MNIQINQNPRERVNNTPLIFAYLSLRGSAETRQSKFLKTAAVFFVFGFLFFGITSSTKAAIYYVGGSGAEDNATCVDEPQTHSCATIQYVFNNEDIDPGDIIEVRAGTYPEMVAWGANDVGDATSQVTLRGAPGETVIIDGANTRAYVIYTSGRSYITIQNITVKDATSVNLIQDVASTGLQLIDITSTGSNTGISLTSASSASISNIDVTVTGTTASRYGFYMLGVSSGTVLNNITATGSQIPIFLVNHSNLTANNLTAKSNWSSSFAGFYLNSLTGTLTGSNWIAGGNGTGNAGHGIWINNCDIPFSISGVTTSYNGTNENQYGLYISDSATSGGSITGIDSNHNTGNGVDLAAAIGHTSGITIQGTSSYNAVHGFQLTGSSASAKTQDNTIRDSVALSNSGDGFDVFSNADNNIFLRDSAIGNGTDSPGSDRGDGYSAHGSSSGNQILYSLAYDNLLSGLAHIQTSAGTVYNSVFYNNGTASQATARGGFWTQNTAGTWILKNNIFSQNIPNELYGSDTTAFAVINADYNQYYHTADSNLVNIGGAIQDWATYHTTNSYEANSKYGDPLFTDSVSADFTLQALSPAINAGTDVGLTSDYIETSVPQGLTPDIGAYEYLLPTAPTIGTSLALSSSSIRYNFTDSANNETEFRIYDNNDTLVTSSAIENLTYLDETGLLENTQYSGRRVAAYNPAGESNLSSTASANYTLADTPTNLSASAITTSTVTLTVDSFPNATADSSGYYFSRTGANSGWIQTNSWQDTGLDCEKIYTYSAKYRNGDGVETSLISNNITTVNCGGGLPPIFYQPPATPVGGFKLTINQDQKTTTNNIVNININAGSDIKTMAISNYSDFINSIQEPYQSTKQWNLCSQKPNCQTGEHTIYAKLYTQYGQQSEVLEDTILYQGISIIATPTQIQTQSANIQAIFQLKQQLIVLIAQAIQMLYEQIALMKL